MSDGQGEEGRRRLVALFVLVLIAVPLVVVALVTRGGDSPAGGLRIERSTVSGDFQIIVYVDQGANVAATADGKSTVELECLDREGNSVIRGVYRWPFTDTDQGTFQPHVHQSVTGEQARRIVRCRLNGTEGPLSGTA